MSKRISSQTMSKRDVERAKAAKRAAKEEKRRRRRNEPK